MVISQIIREKRKQLGLTQENVAEYLGVSTPAVSKWENGTTYPDIMLLPALARLLDVYKRQIVDIVRGMSIPLAELPVVLQQIRAGATLGQNVPKSETEDKEDTE